MASRHVVFSHGLESGPWGTKISAMSEVAKSEGWHVDSVDYRGVNDPRDRVTRLLSFCRDIRGDLVLVGSSLGAYVATSASALTSASTSPVRGSRATSAACGRTVRLRFTSVASMVPA